MPILLQEKIKDAAKIDDDFDLVLEELSDAFVYYRYSNERICHTTNLKDIVSLTTAVGNSISKENF